jgi:rubrerythrin
MLDELDVTDCPQCGALVASDVHTACPECGDSPSYAAALNGTAY